MIDQYPHFFYPLKRHWIEKGLLPVLAVLFLGTVLILRFNFVAGVIGAALLAWYLFYRDIQPLLQTYLEINQDTLSGLANRHRIHLFWQDVLVVQQTGTLKQGFIHLITPQTRITIPLQLFDGDKLWQVVKSCVPGSALETDAYKKLPAYQEYQQEKARIIHTLTEPLRAGYNWGIKVMAWGCLIFSVWVMRELFKEVSFSSILWLPGAFFVASSFCIYHFSKYVEMSSSAIAVVSWLGRKEMKWSEIQRVKCRYGAGRITELIFFNDDKKELKVTGPVNWYGTNKIKMVDFLEVQIEQHQIEVHQEKRGFSIYS